MDFMWNFYRRNLKKKEEKTLQNGMHTVYIPGNLHAGSTEVSFSCQKFCVYLWVYDRVKQQLYSYIDFCIMFQMAK